MVIKETIAFIGTPGENGKDLLVKLARKNYHLLLEYGQVAAGEETEVIDCVENGCWEADIIILANIRGLEKGLIAKIKNVSTQKIVVLLSEKNGAEEAKALQELLPYSMVMGLFYDEIRGETILEGIAADALQTVSRILEEAGYARPAIRQRPA